MASNRSRSILFVRLRMAVTASEKLYLGTYTCTCNQAHSLYYIGFVPYVTKLHAFSCITSISVVQKREKILQDTRK